MNTGAPSHGEGGGVRTPTGVSTPTSAQSLSDKQAQKEAEAFISDILLEVMEHDKRNAVIMQNYLNKAKFWKNWSILSIFSNNNSDNNTSGNSKGGSTLVEVSSASIDTNQNSSSSSSSLDTSQYKDSYIYIEGRDGSVLYRTRDSAQDPITSSTNNNNNTNTNNNTAAFIGTPSQTVTATATSIRYNPLLFKKVNPTYTPIYLRWWVPYSVVCMIGLIWTPDVWKLRALYWADYQYAYIRHNIHKQYWWLTMDSDQYTLKIAQMEAGLPRHKQVPGSNCPL